MDSFIIKGPSKLKGRVNVSGSKNAALPIMAACIAKPGEYTLNNVPDLRDTRTMIRLLEIIGAKVSKMKDKLTIDTVNCSNPEAPYELVKTMRASFYALGPLISRFKYCKVSLPGGCAWGPRPVDYHIKAFKKLGANGILNEGYIIAKGRLKGSRVIFEKSSVGATGNVLMACANLDQKVIIENAAKEPEIVDLCNFLIKTGMSIKGIGSSTLIVLGNSKEDKSLKISYRIISDRIEAGTFLIAAAATHSSIILNNVEVDHLRIIIESLEQSGSKIEIIDESSVKIITKNKIIPVNIKTDIYPGFPTDLQAQWVALMCLASGNSYIEDTVYHDRFSHISELNRLGAEIYLNKNIAFVNAPQKLFSANVMSTDIRASASLVIAALASNGTTKLSRIYHIDRGYENMELKLEKLSVDIKRVNN